MIRLGSQELRAVGLQSWYPTQRLHSLSWLLAPVLPSGLSLALVWACLSPALPNPHHIPEEHHCISDLRHSAALCQVHTPAAQPNPGMTWQAHCPDCEQRLTPNTTNPSCDLLSLLRFQGLMLIFLFISICCRFGHCFTHTFNPKSFDTGSPFICAHANNRTNDFMLCCMLS